MKKAVILAGGTGSRMLPATKNQNKHLLPIYSDKCVPMIFYPIKTLVESGLNDILIISSREHCGQIMEHLGDGSEFNANFTYKIQDTKYVSLGIASALKIAKNFTNNEKFATILGDNFFEENFKTEVQKFQKSDLPCHLFLKEVEDIQRFGCATVQEGKITKIVEKPNNPESNLAVTGLYFYTSHVYEVANILKLSDRGELEITDINKFYCPNLSYKILDKCWTDMGTPESMSFAQNYIKENKLSHLINSIH